MRYLLLEKYGGVQHIVRPIPKSWTNQLGWQDDGHVKINGAIMGNPFLLAAIRTAIPLLLDRYDPTGVGATMGPDLLTGL
jgi:hypothetical protein